MKNEYRLKRIHFSVCLTKIDAVNFFFKKLGTFSCQNVRCRCQLPVLSFPSSPFDSVCKPGLLFDDVATYPKENHTNIFPFVAKNHITISTIYHVRFLMEIKISHRTHRTESKPISYHKGDEICMTPYS